MIRTCASLPDPDEDSSEVQATVIYTLGLLASRIQALKAEAYELHKRLHDMVSRHAPQLLDRSGVGPDSAAALLIAASDNPARLRREGSYAALCGVSPVEGSSGLTRRRRLNRGGDRQANAALYRIPLSRLRWDPRTQNYLQRRLARANPPGDSPMSQALYRPRDLPAPAPHAPLDIHRGIGLTGLPEVALDGGAS